MNPLFYFSYMITSAKRHFPQFRFSDEAKWLFNPVLKRRFVNRPEERVRLQYVEFLLEETDFNKNRIGFEAPIKLPEAENSLRADLVLYTHSMNPFALIECKSENIRLNNHTAEQIARYNRRLNAKYLMVTNGTEEIWYSIEDQITALSEPPLNQKNASPEYVNSLDYWVNRGFICAKSTNGIKQLALKILQSNRLTLGPDEAQYLDIPPTLAAFPLDHYYYISTIEPEYKMGIGILDNGRGSTILSVVLNREGKNHGILWINLDDLTATNGRKATLITPSGKRSIDLPEKFSQELIKKDDCFLKNIRNQLLLFFD